jgi:sensor domain CHASE-containing protein
MEDKVIIFFVATIVVIALILVFTVPAIRRHNKEKEDTQEINQKTKIKH